VQGSFQRGEENLSKPTLNGKWDEGLTAVMEDGSKLDIWRKNPPPPDPTRCARRP